MNAQERIDKANAEIAAARTVQAQCFHEWSEPKAVTRYRKEGHSPRYVGKGSDPEMVYQGYTDVPYTIWERHCKQCGLKQETEQTEPVVASHRPVFR